MLFKNLSKIKGRSNTTLRTSKVNYLILYFAGICVGCGTPNGIHQRRRVNLGRVINVPHSIDSYCLVHSLRSYLTVMFTTYHIIYANYMYLQRYNNHTNSSWIPAPLWSASLIDGSEEMLRKPRDQDISVASVPYTLAHCCFSPLLQFYEVNLALSAAVRVAVRSIRFCMEHLNKWSPSPSENCLHYCWIASGITVRTLLEICKVLMEPSSE